MRRAIGLLSMALVALLPWEPAAHAQAPKEVVIGILYPLSGPVAQVGIDSVNAVKMAVEIINSGGSTLNLPLGKSAGLPGLGGAKISSVTATASQVAERYGMPYLNAESSSPGLTERGFKWFFRTSPHDGHFSVAMFDFMKDLEKRRGVKIKTLGIMHEDTLFGVDSAKVQEELAKKHGYEVAVKMAYRAKTTSLDAEVGKRKATNPDVFLPTSYTSDAIIFVKTAKNLDYNPKMLIAQNAGWTDPSFLTEMGKEAEGHITRAPFALDMADKKPMIKPINALFKKLRDNPGGRDISDVPARAFTGFIVLADAINRAKSVNPEEIRKALAATNMPPEQLIMP